MKMLKPLPIGIQSFETLVKDGYLYVDKTEQLYHLAQRSPRYFLSRPRRFGKSLLCSTLAALFEGKKELFKGLWIEKSDWKWEQYHVVYIDFNTIAHATPERLELSLHTTLDNIASLFKVDVQGLSIVSDKFVRLVNTLAQTKKVVLLIDEYDKPMIMHLTKPDVAEEMRQILRGFYGTIKGLDEHLRFVLLTGVTKFSKVSIFSELNNLFDLTFSNSAATLLGYTHAELVTNFADHIDAFATRLKIPHQELTEQLIAWYDGYRFSSEGEKVFNPFSVMWALKEQQFGNYWFESGTTNFLIDLIKNHNFEPPTLEPVLISGRELGSFDIQSIKLTTLLAQAGYLTMVDYDVEGNNYTLDCPNYEVRRSLAEQVVELMVAVPGEVYGAMISGLRKSLAQNDIENFCTHLQTFLAQIPYTIHLKHEKYYQSLFYSVLMLMCLEAQVEVATNVGRIDATLKTKKHIYIIEFKVGGKPQDAIDQIIEKKYAQGFALDKRPVTMVGIAFHKKKKNVELEWLVQPAQ